MSITLSLISWPWGISAKCTNSLEKNWVILKVHPWGFIYDGPFTHMQTTLDAAVAMWWLCPHEPICRLQAVCHYFEIDSLSWLSCSFSRCLMSHTLLRSITNIMSCRMRALNSDVQLRWMPSYSPPSKRRNEGENYPNWASMGFGNLYLVPASYVWCYLFAEFLLSHLTALSDPVSGWSAVCNTCKLMLKMYL